MGVVLALGRSIDQHGMVDDDEYRPPGADKPGFQRRLDRLVDIVGEFYDIDTGVLRSNDADRLIQRIRALSGLGNAEWNAAVNDWAGVVDATRDDLAVGLLYGIDPLAALNNLGKA